MGFFDTETLGIHASEIIHVLDLTIFCLFLVQIVRTATSMIRILDSIVLL